MELPNNFNISSLQDKGIVIDFAEPEISHSPWNISFIFLQYVLIFPALFLCCSALIHILRKRGYISGSEAQNIMEEMRSIPPPILSPQFKEKRASHYLETVTI